MLSNKFEISTLINSAQKIFPSAFMKEQKEPLVFTNQDIHKELYGLSQSYILDI